MSTASGEFVCPHCARQVAVTDPESQEIIVCPLCGGEFSIPAMEEESPEGAPPQEDQLDSERIRKFAQIRRATYRSRSYAIIAAGACCVAVAQLGVMLIRETLTAGFGFWPVAYILGAVGSMYGAWRFIARAMELNQEMSRSLIHMNHASEPDFSQLSDGSQRAGNLEQIR